MNDKLDTNAALQAYGNALRAYEAAVERTRIAEKALEDAKQARYRAADVKNEAFENLQEALR